MKSGGDASDFLEDFPFSIRRCKTRLDRINRVLGKRGPVEAECTLHARIVGVDIAAKVSGIV